MTTWLPVGPPELGMSVGAEADVEAGWLTRPFRAGAGLDGPAGILQGGLAAAVPTAAAQLADQHGAPLTSVTARLHAPTPLEADLQLALRPAEGIARHAVELRAEGTLLVSATAELAGRDTAPDVADLAELATGPVPQLVVHDEYPHCFVCGPDNRHPHAQRCGFGHVGHDAVVLPWLVEDDLATPAQTVDPLLVSAILDCPGVWAATPTLLEAGYHGCLLAGTEVRWYAEAPAFEVLRIGARLDQVDGRKVRVRSALLDEDGKVYAIASALHIAVTEVPTLA